MIQALQLLLSLSILVVLHEFGHYITAKMFGCRVEKFYLFMDWPYTLFKKKIGETEFGIGCAPLGGYVKIAGFIDESMDTDGLESVPQPWELRAKPAWQRLIVMLGGIFVNLILAWFIYTIIAFSWGEKYIPMSSLTGGFTFNESAQKLGFQNQDRLISIDGSPILEFDPMMIVGPILFEGANEVVVLRGEEEISVLIDSKDVYDIIKNMSKKDPPFLQPNLDWVVGGFTETSIARENGVEKGDQILQINDFQTTYYGGEVRNYILSQAGKGVVLKISRSNKIYFIDFVLGDDGQLGVFSSIDSYQESRSYSFLESIPVGFVKTRNMIKMYWGQMKTIFNPSTGGYKHVGGVISIGQMFPGEWNWLAFWSMTALLSIILAVMNLLPIPALDGGHALIAIVEMCSGKKIPIKVLMPLQVAGMVILFALLIYANGMDVVRLFN